VDDTLGACPRFRIVLVGKSGVGKSSLIANVFNIDKDKIDIAHDRAGHADIEDEYTSPENPRFILHDSMGFEPGSESNWEKVEKCLKKRQGYELPEKIHAIWFCGVTPRTGTRLLQTGDEKLLQLAKEFHIPIIAVFTKYDLLINQFFQEDPATAEEKALAFFDHSVKVLQEELVRLSIDLLVPCVKVSTEETNTKQTLINLTRLLVTSYETLSVNWRFFGSRLSRSMLARRSRFLSAKVLRSIGGISAKAAPSKARF